MTLSLTVRLLGKLDGALVEHVLQNYGLVRSLSEHVRIFDIRRTQMTRKILILALLSVTTFFALPADSYAQRQWRTRDRSYSRSTYSQDRWDNRWDNRRNRRHYNRRYRDTYGYRNYGQYRRTQVGNRRFRLVRQYYWNRGRRIPRWTRLYY